MSENVTLSAKERRIYIEALEAAGYSVDRARKKEPIRASILRGLAKPGQTVKIGVASDPHLGSKFQQITYLRDFYAYADSRGVSAYINAGDFVDGPVQFHRDHVYGNFRHGFEAQIKYAVEAYPKSANGPTYFVAGNHDLGFIGSAGASVGEALASRRDDLVNLGDHSASIDIGPARIFVAHGARGGLSYARSYRMQKLLEQMDHKERDDTDLALYGHWHVAAHMPGYQGVEAFLVPCFQRQTPFLKTLGLQPVIGGLVLEIEFGAKGVWDVRVDWRIYREPLASDYPGSELDE